MLTRYPAPLPCYTDLHISWHVLVEHMFYLGLVRRPYITRTSVVVHEDDVKRFTVAYPTPADLALYLSDIRAAQKTIRHLRYTVPVSEIYQFGDPMTHDRDIWALINCGYLRAKRQQDLKGRPYYVAQQSIDSLIKLLDSGPLQRLTKE